VKSKSLQFGALVFCVIVWALSFPVIKYLLMHFEPVSLSTFRYLLGSLALLIPFAIKRDVLIRELRARWGLFLIFALVTVPLPDLFQNFGIRLMSAESAASVASILQSMGPLFILILAALFLSESITPYKGLGVGISFAGAALLATNGLSNIETGNIAGEGLVLMSALSYAVSGIIGKELLFRASALSIITWSYFFGALFLLPVYSLNPVLPVIDTPVLLALLFLSVVTLIPYFLWYLVLKDNEVSRQSAFIFLIPFFGVIFSSIFMGERLSPEMALYGGLIVFGVWVAQRGGEEREGEK